MDCSTKALDMLTINLLRITLSDANDRALRRDLAGED